MTKIFDILLFCSILTLISCSDERYTENGIEQIVQTTDSLLADLAGQKYEWASKSAYSTIMAYYPTSDIIFLNENLTYRTPAEALNFYYFKDRSLIRFIKRMLKYYKDENGNAKKDLYNLTIYFDPDGDVISYEKIVNREKVSLTDEEVDEIISHANELYKLVGDEE